MSVHVLDDGIGAIPANETDVDPRVRETRALSGGRTLLVLFDEPPSDEIRGRLGMLLELFRTALEEASPAMSGTNAAPVANGPVLHEQLSLLAERARAVDAIVIDAHSPVVWGAADPNTMLAWAKHEPVADVIPFRRPARESTDPKAASSSEKSHRALPSDSDRAIALVRSLPEILTLHRGGKLARTVVMGDFACVARSFAGIYVIVLVFRGKLDEIAANQALAPALPVIEKLVLSLPPMDPTPRTRGAMALRRRPRR